MIYRIYNDNELIDYAFNLEFEKIIKTDSRY